MRLLEMMKMYLGNKSIGIKPDLYGVTTVKNVLKAFILSFSLMFSLNSFGVVDLIRCKSHYNLEKYNELHQRIKKNPRITSIYNLGIVSLCLGKEEGMSHLQKASDSGHIAATHLLGLYFMANRSFNRAERGRISNLDDFNSAIHYYEKAAQMIEETDNYPRGATADMDDIEYYVYTSYYVFATIPELYFSGYDKAIKDIVNSQDKVSYVDTLEVLKKMRDSAERCVNRPSLSSWEDKGEDLYQVQQVRCGAYLNYAREVLPLEEGRIQIAQGCGDSLSECSNHQDILNQINQVKSMMNGAISSIPSEYLRR